MQCTFPKCCLILESQLRSSHSRLEDNAACIAQAKSGIRHVKNAKHYQVKLRFLQQLVVDKDIDFVYCPTEQQLADFFTKPLVDGKFRYFRDYIFGIRHKWFIIRHFRRDHWEFSQLKRKKMVVYLGSSLRKKDDGGRFRIIVTKEDGRWLI